MNLKAFMEWVYHRWFADPHHNDLAVMALGLCGEAGEASEHVKKQLRDRTGKHIFDRQAFLLEMGDTLNYWCALALYYDISVEEIMLANIDKCETRNASDNPPNFITPRLPPIDLVAVCEAHLK